MQLRRCLGGSKGVKVNLSGPRVVPNGPSVQTSWSVQTSHGYKLQHKSRAQVPFSPKVRDKSVNWVDQVMGYQYMYIPIF